MAKIQLGLDVRPQSDDGGMRFGTETENCTDLKMSGGAETVQFAALRRSGTKTGPFLVRYRGGGIRFPEDRGGVEATRRVKLNGAENENRYKNGTETFRNVRAGWVSRWGVHERHRPPLATLRF